MNVNSLEKYWMQKEFFFILLFHEIYPIKQIFDKKIKTKHVCFYQLVTRQYAVNLKKEA
jgi:hypothetical protein